MPGLRESLRRFHVVSLGARDYLIVVRTLADAGLAGGIIYDALAARAAAKTHAKRILTLNQRDFDRLEAIFDVQATSP